MTHIVSIVTPVYAPAAGYIRETYDSLASQVLPPGWDWQWCVQEDGHTGTVDYLTDLDPRIEVGHGRRGGEAITRNLALARADGELVKVLDADDLLTPGTLDREIKVMAARPHVMWTTCRVLDLMPDGGTVGFDDDPPAGTLEQGAVLGHWLTHGYRAQVHPATMCVRYGALMALGGWMALPAGCDTGLMMALNATSTGWFVREVGMLYRKWPGQLTADAAHTDPVELPLRNLIIERRAQALLASGMSLTAAAA